MSFPPGRLTTFKFFVIFSHQPFLSQSGILVKPTYFIKCRKYPVLLCKVHPTAVLFSTDTLWSWWQGTDCPSLTQQHRVFTRNTEPRNSQMRVKRSGHDLILSDPNPVITAKLEALGLAAAFKEVKWTLIHVITLSTQIWMSKRIILREWRHRWRCQRFENNFICDWGWSLTGRREPYNGSWNCCCCCWRTPAAKLIMNKLLEVRDGE